MRQTTNLILRSVSVLALAGFLFPQTGHGDCDEPPPTNAASRMIQYCITFSGTASGGTLYFVQFPQGSTPMYVSIETSKGESAEEVVRRLAAAIGGSGWLSAEAAGATLRRIPGALGLQAFGGTETGLGIPQPPLFLSGSYDAIADRITLRWTNPTDGYDSVSAGCGRISSNATSCSFGMNGHFVSSKIDYAFGVRHGIPSPYAVITVAERAQEELACLPFCKGIMPNWSTWCTSRETGAARFDQGVKPGVDLLELQRLPRRIRGPADKPFFQLIKVSKTDVQAGVWRKFLGLTPGHTYRLYARLNTLAMDAAKDTWSYSLHTTYNAPGGSDLTADQLGGKASLPNGSKGITAGRIAHYGPGTTTKGEWVQHSTGDTGSEAKDLTLPQGVDSITVWVRHSGVDSSGVGIDWVKLEDVTK